LISEFDPWRSPLCTCPAKLTLNPYTGCDHACVYCYASSYIPKFFNCRPKKELVSKLRRECRNLKGEMISMSNSSDPYPNLESETGLTRQCLEIMSTCNCKIQIITKSTLVTRDIDILKKTASMVSMTITTDDDTLAKLLEPNAPPPSERLKAARTLIEKGIPTSVRIDPIIPFLNDHPENLIKTLSSLGVKHVTGSTYKIRPDNWRRFSQALPETAEKLRPLYFEKGERIHGYLLLHRDLRLRLMKNVSTLAAKHGMKFGTCREDLAFLNTAACDGSWLIRR
jgi:DNA repair photolyase